MGALEPSNLIEVYVCANSKELEYKRMHLSRYQDVVEERQLAAAAVYHWTMTNIMLTGWMAVSPSTTS